MPILISGNNQTMPSDFQLKVAENITPDEATRRALLALGGAAGLAPVQQTKDIVRAFLAKVENDPDRPEQSKLANVQARLRATKAKLAETDAAILAAEQVHFASLTGSDDAAVDRSRQAVIEMAVKRDLIAGEVTTLEGLLPGLESQVKTGRSSALVAACRAMQTEQKSRHWAAVATLKALIATDDFKSAMADLLESSFLGEMCDPAKTFAIGRAFLQQQ